MRIGERLLDAALATGSRSLFVVGTGKNAGKTVTLRAMASAARRAGIATALLSTGRDGEAVDAGSADPKPRLYLPPWTLLSTTRSLLPPHPAVEVLELTPHTAASGQVVLARTRAAAYYELAGPPNASAVHDTVARLMAHGAEFALVDGALDRIAVLAEAHGAVVVAVGADAGTTVEEAAAAAGALAARLRIPAWDPAQPALRIEGALTASAASELAAAGEDRQIVVADAAKIVMSGRELEHALRRLRLRCERALRVVGVTVASIGRERYFEPRAFVRAVASATQLPVYDVYAELAA